MNALARELSIECIELSDLLVLDEGELYEVVRAAAEEAMLTLFACLKALSGEEAMKVSEVVAHHGSTLEAVKALNLDRRALKEELRSSGGLGFTRVS